MTLRPDDTDWNGDGYRELHRDSSHLDESVYCTVCGTIFVRAGTSRNCPSCTNRATLEELLERVDELGDRVEAAENAEAEIIQRLERLAIDDETIAEHIVDAHESIDDRLEDLERRVDRAERDIDLVDGGGY